MKIQVAVVYYAVSQHRICRNVNRLSPELQISICNG